MNAFAGSVGFVLLIFGVCSTLGSIHYSRRLLEIKREVLQLNAEGQMITAGCLQGAEVLRRLLRDLREECPSCSGSGLSVKHAPSVESIISGRVKPRPCPRCAGEGLTPRRRER
jgi:hypothetical protein